MSELHHINFVFVGFLLTKASQLHNKLGGSFVKCEGLQMWCVSTVKSVGLPVAFV